MKYVVLMGHDSDAPKDVKSCDTYDEAVEVANDFFLQYYPEGLEGVDQEDEFEAITVLGNGKVAGFEHAMAEGPVCEIRKG